MGEGHLSDAVLSGYLDRELSALDERRARLHLAACPDCAAQLAAFSRLDLQLADAPALGCAAALTLLSGQLDGELAPEPAAVATAHLETCGACRASVARWSDVEAQLVALPGGMPSARVDRAIAGLVRPRPGLAPRRGIALRGALVAVVAVLTLILSGLPRLAPAQVATPIVPGGTPTLVASVQQAVLDARTNTLYVIEPDQAAVAARNAGTNSLIARIPVGGKPIALTLDETANTVLVLDAEAKTITTIDAKQNTVVSSSTVAVAGTPTSLQAVAGKILVTAVSDAKPAATNGTANATGLVAVINGSSKQVETVRTIDVAPRLIVVDRTGTTALLLGPDGTVVADAATYRQLDKLPGGVGAAFGGDLGTTIAILSADGGGARVSFSGSHAPAAVTLSGKPVAITSVPGGGFGILVDVAGHGQVVSIGPDGRAAGVPIDVAIAGSDIAYDAVAGHYVVSGPAGVRFAGVFTLGSPVPTPPPASSAPAPSPSASVSARPSASPSGSPTASASPSATKTPAPSAVAQPLVPDGARLLWDGTYVLDVAGGKVATVVGGSGTRLWFVDQFNILETLDTVTGRAGNVIPLPREAKISLITTSPNFVYAIDATHAKVYALDLGAQKLLTAPVEPAASVVAAATTPDDRLWFVTGSSSLVGYDPTKQRVQVVDVPGAELIAVAADTSGRVWFASEEGRRFLGSYDVTSRKLAEIRLDRDGAVTALAVDPSGALVVGTDAGELFSLRGTSSSLLSRVGGSILALAVEGDRTTWYLAQGGDGVRFAPIDGSSPAGIGPNGVSGLSIDILRRAWLPDRSTGGFYLVLQKAR